MAEFEIAAKVVADDGNFVVHFDAVVWFQQASAYQLVKLAQDGWGGNYSADEVARFCAQDNLELQRFFQYLEVLTRASKNDGFECHITQEEALRWLHSDKRFVTPPVNPNCNLFYRHSLPDHAEGRLGRAEVVIEADPGWVSLSVWKPGGNQIADVSLELFEGSLVLRAWNDKDFGEDPTAKVTLCKNPST